MAVTMMRTPGVYINELNAFPNSIVEVPTAIPAFIGYTARASYEGKSYLNKAVAITSFQEYMAFFGIMAPPPGGGAPVASPPSAQYAPIYYPVPAAPGEGDVQIGGAGGTGGTEYSLVPDPGTLYNMYNGIRLFYENGGGSAYVVSVGLYGKATGKAATTPQPYVNPNVQLNDLMGALAILENEPEPTMIVIPDGTLLAPDDNENLMQAVLQHCGLMKNRVAIFDVIGGAKPDPILWPNDITTFRTDTGEDFLNFGIAYYPFLETTIMQDPDISFRNVGGGVPALLKLLPEAATDPVKTILANAQQAQTSTQVTQAENALRIASQSYMQLHTAMLAQMNIQPPSAMMAGVYTLVDDTQGVWKAPANVSVVGAVKPTYNLSDVQQEDLNVDATTGKSINAIRLFTGKGVLVWGARTLDGNSLDWRYVNVRRTMIMIEQSIKLALNDFVFEPNDEATWASVSSMVSTFLTNLWSQGALAGGSAADAFTVAVGLGKTMTAVDILNGTMIVVVKVAVTHPAEFIVITISQQLQKA